jgi:hypothetical protein
VSAATLRPGAERYDQALCCLPDCDAPLYFSRMESRAIYLTDTAEDIRSAAHSSSWEVECENGHKILLPPPTAEDDYTFGVCRIADGDGECDHDPPDCPRHDLYRLRDVLSDRTQNAARSA